MWTPVVSGLSRTVWRRVVDDGAPRDERDALLQPHQQQEQPDPQPRRQRRTPVPGKDRRQRTVHPRRRVLVEEQIAELRRVEPDDKSPERSVARALTPREPAEPP